MRISDWSSDVCSSDLIGFGDAVTPAPVDIRYPSMLDQPMAELRAYPPETVVAEKFQAMVALDMINTRLKDFYDLWAIANAFEFDGTVLARAIAATFERRQTKVPAQIPAALTAAYADERLGQWAAFLRRTEIVLAPEPFPDGTGQIERLVKIGRAHV